MPLADRAVALLVLTALAAFVPVFSAQTTEPVPGRVPFDRVCKVCHGEEARGGAAPSLVPFTMDADELLIRVREGGGEMPPISQTRVSDEEVRQIAAYLTSLSPPDAAADVSSAPNLLAR